MKEQEISLQTAKLAKLKGFDWECRGYYYPNGKFENTYQEGFGRLNWNKDIFSINKFEVKGLAEKYSAPTQSLLQKWLRDVHNIHINILHSTNQSMNGEIWANCYEYFINGETYYTYCTDYESCLEAALLEALNDKS